MIEPREEINNPKPGFDGRLNYFRHLEKLMDGLAISAVSYDYGMWLKWLIQYYSITSPYISSEKLIDSLELELEELEKYYNNYSKIQKFKKNGYVDNKIHTKFRKFQQRLIRSTKHLLLPLNSEEEFEFSEKSFMEASDL